MLLNKILRILLITVGRTNIQNPLDFLIALLVDRHKRGRLRYHGGNFDSYGRKITPIADLQKAVLCDPQTSGGLLIAVKPDSEKEVFAVAKTANVEL
ncbi:hypothetical protein MY896_01140 [Haemophilus influenzae]|nr:hypothetical protein [Haemophilus influenzae]